MNILASKENEIVLKEDRVRKHTEARDVEELKLDQAERKLIQKIDEITNIRNDIQKIKHARDHYENSRRRYSADLNRLKKERDEIRMLLNSQMDTGCTVEEIQSDEE